ncbi:MAG: SufD family Fe-S cluster assembly protein [Chloroflexi bacterium]|nr:SufD family Fe-S cluster assembly protein [Chloroflexota bacterium]
MIRTEAQRLSLEAVGALSWANDEPEWLQERRREAWRIYESIPMPKPTDEEWRRTDLSGLVLDEVLPFVADGASVATLGELPRDLRQALGEMQTGGLLVQRNSDAAYRRLDPELEKRGVLFIDLETAARDYPELVQQYLLGEALPPSYGKFAALHAAFWSGGMLLYVPRGVEIDIPLRAHTWMDIPRMGIFPHTLVVLEPGAKALLLDEYVSPTLDGLNLASAGVEIYLGEGAQLTYAQAQDWGRNKLQYWTCCAGTPGRSSPWASSPLLPDTPLPCSCPINTPPPPSSWCVRSNQ